MSNVLDNLEQQLERSIENIRQIQIIVSDFQPQGQPVLNQVCHWNAAPVTIKQPDIDSRIKDPLPWLKFRWVFHS